MALDGLIAPCTISLLMWLLRLAKEPRSAGGTEGMASHQLCDKGRKAVLE